MCRNIKTLFNFNPPATDDEIRAASLQFVRKLSGFNNPSKANEAAFNSAVDEVASAARKLMDSLVTGSDPRNRQVELERARVRNVKRFGNPTQARTSGADAAERIVEAKMPDSSEGESDLPAGLAQPAVRALAAAGYLHLEQFTKLSEAEVKKLHGMGPKAMELIRRALAEKGMTFGSGS
jgi:hypothetical protein